MQIINCDLSQYRISCHSQTRVHWLTCLRDANHSSTENNIPDSLPVFTPALVFSLFPFTLHAHLSVTFSNPYGSFKRLFSGGNVLLPNETIFYARSSYSTPPLVWHDLKKKLINQTCQHKPVNQWNLCVVSNFFSRFGGSNTLFVHFMELKWEVKSPTLSLPLPLTVSLQIRFNCSNVQVLLQNDEPPRCHR